MVGARTNPASRTLPPGHAKMELDGTTAILSKAYCSARDRNIPVLVSVPLSSDSRPNSTDATELVSCLDYGVRCTGWLCPIYGAPSLPTQELLEEAIRMERRRRRRTFPDGGAILARAVREGRVRRAETARKSVHGGDEVRGPSPDRTRVL